MDHTEKKYAQQLLAFRRTEYSFWEMLRINAIQHAIQLFVVLAIMVAAYLDTLLWVKFGAYFICGVAAGTVLRDWAWSKSFRRTIPFYDKVVNWSLVREIASDESKIPAQGAPPDSN